MRLNNNVNSLALICINTISVTSVLSKSFPKSGIIIYRVHGDLSEGIGQFVAQDFEKHVALEQ